MKLVLNNDDKWVSHYFIIQVTNSIAAIEFRILVHKLSYEKLIMNETIALMLTFVWNYWIINKITFLLKKKI